MFKLRRKILQIVERCIVQPIKEFARYVNDGTIAISDTYSVEMDAEKFIEHLIECRPIKIDVQTNFSSLDVIYHNFSFEYNKTTYRTTIYSVSYEATKYDGTSYKNGTLLNEKMANIYNILIRKCRNKQILNPWFILKRTDSL